MSGGRARGLERELTSFMAASRGERPLDLLGVRLVCERGREREQPQEDGMVKREVMKTWHTCMSQCNCTYYSYCSAKHFG